MKIFSRVCLHLQNSTMGCLGMALDDVLDTSMSLASNLLLNRRDNFLKLCHRDVTDKDIARLRNASLTKKELFNSKVLSEVEQNLIQWSQINREPAFKKQRRFLWFPFFCGFEEGSVTKQVPECYVSEFSFSKQAE